MTRYTKITVEVIDIPDVMGTIESSLQVEMGAHSWVELDKDLDGARFARVDGNAEGFLSLPNGEDGLPRSGTKVRLTEIETGGDALVATGIKLVR